MSQFGQTYVHPVAVSLTLAMGVYLLWARRAQAVLPVLVVACFIPDVQRVVVAGQDFSMIRILVLFGLVKIVTTRERSDFKLHRIDVWFCLWLASAALVYTLREGSMAALTNRLGYAFEGMGIYFLFRTLLGSVPDVLRALRVLAWISIPIGALMIVENVTGRNLFSTLGGVAEFTVVRDGRLRAQGAFSHPIMMGTFGATLAPMFVALILVTPRSKRMLPYLGLAASIVITLLSASSGPLMALLFGFVAWGLWPARARLALIRYGVIAVLVIVHFAREQPVWQLIGRLSSITGGTGYHRFRLIDGFINHFDEWWLLGTSSTLHWFTLNSDDLTNQFVVEGVRGGLLTLAVFIAMLGSAFSALGRMRIRASSSPDMSRAQRNGVAYLSWGLGATLTTHCVSFISAAYFGQMLSIFILELAMVVSLCSAPQLVAARNRVEQRVDVPVQSNAPA